MLETAPTPQVRAEQVLVRTRRTLVSLGTNMLLADLNPNTTGAALRSIWSGRAKQGVIPPLWDGKAAERIAQYFHQI